MPGPLLAITVDRLPAWLVPAYGATWVAMPAVTGLAARGVVFDGLVATSDDPRDAARQCLGWLGGPGGGRRAVVTDDPGLPDGLTEADALTVVPVVVPPRPAVDESATNLSRLFAAAAAVAAERRHDVVWCHASSLGLSWDAPAEFRDAYLDPDDPPPPAGAAVPDLVVTADTDPDLVAGLRHVFAGQLTLLDRCVARLVAAAGDEWTILVAGLRGMPLGLHGRMGPGSLPPYAELVRLPAIVVDRGGRMAGQRFDGLVTPADLGVTLERVVAGTAADGLAGGAAAAGGVAGAGRGVDSLFTDWSAAGRDRVIVTVAAGAAVVTPHWHLVHGDRDGEPLVRLFAKPDDCFDLCDVADRCPAVVEALRPLAEAARAGDLARAWEAPLGAGGLPAA